MPSSDSLVIDLLYALQLETERGFIMSIFMQVPLVVVKRLHRTAERSVLSLRSQMDKQHTGESDSELDDEEVRYEVTRQPSAGSSAMQASICCSLLLDAYVTFLTQPLHTCI